jgi:hypothetical protein
MYRAAGPAAVKTLSDLVNAIDKAGSTAVGGAAAAYTLTGRRPETKIDV